MKTCNIEGCKKKHDARGYCHTHYLRWRKHGDPLVVLPSRPPKSTKYCTIEDCKRIYVSKGLCHYHYIKKRRANEVKNCKVQDCDEKILAKHLCSRHHHRYLKNMPLEKKSWQEMSLQERIEKYRVIDDNSGCWIWVGGKGGKGYGSITYNNKSHRAHRISYEVYIGDIPDGMIVCHKCDNPPCVNPAHLFLGSHLDNSQDKFSKNRERILRGQDNGCSKLSDQNIRDIKSMLKNGVSGKEIAKIFNVTGANISSIKNNKTWSHINV